MIGFGHPDDAQWIVGELRALPVNLQSFAVKKYKSLFRRGRAVANTFLRQTAEKSRNVSRWVAKDEEVLVRKAKECAKNCGLTGSRIVGTDLQRFEILAQVALSNGVIPPDLDKVTPAAGVKRLQCERWWRRNLRRVHAQGVETVSILTGAVNRYSNIYVSDDGLSGFQSQKKRNRDLLEAMTAINELEEEFSLAELSDSSVSNPVNRRNELMVRIRGFEELAKESGHAGEFWTITTPSKMHPSSKKYDGTTPKEAQQYLSRQWAKMRAKFKRDGINVYGFRIAEPHHDSTPHWHCLFFMEQSAVDDARAIVKHYALEVDGSESGAKKHRFTWKAIDWSKGSAAGYVAKYVSKNIDGQHAEIDNENGDCAMKNAERVNAWANRWGIRQFQQIGGHSVTVWRELRRLRDDEQDEYILFGALESARMAAVGNDWAGYIKAMGGLSVPPKDAEIKPFLLQDFDLETGEIKTNAYGELTIGNIVGITAGDIVIPTRPHRWEVRISGADAEPWSSINNCTRSNPTIEATNKILAQQRKNLGIFEQSYEGYLV